MTQQRTMQEHKTYQTSIGHDKHHVNIWHGQVPPHCGAVSLSLRDADGEWATRQRPKVVLQKDTPFHLSGRFQILQSSHWTTDKKNKELHSRTAHSVVDLRHCVCRLLTSVVVMWPVRTGVTSGLMFLRPLLPPAVINSRKNTPIRQIENER